MAEELSFAARTDNKRKYEDQTTPPPSSAPRRATGFSAPIASPSPDSTHSHPPTYSNVPPPVDEIQLAKQRAQEIAARLFSNAEAKRPRVENGSGTDEANDKSFASAPTDLGQKPPSQFGFAPPSTAPIAYGFQGSSKKIDIPNGRVGVIIGKGGETIKYLQLQSGAKIQVTRDMDADPNSPTRMVELMGTPEQISKAEQLINDVLSEAETGGSGIVSRRVNGQPGAEQFIMKVPNNKVGLVIGKGGETIKNLQARSGARIQLVPLHLPPGDTSTERTVQIDGTNEQIESAKQLVNEVISDNRVRNPQMGGGYPQQGYRPPRPPTNWGPPGPPPMQQPGYGYMQPGAYPGPPPQYNLSQPAYAGYPPQQTSSASGWDQTPTPPNQQTTPGSGYDYYSQPPPQQQQSHGGSSAPAESTGYSYGQAPPSGYGQPVSYSESNYTQPPAGQQQGGYPQDGYGGGYHAPAPQPGYGQPQPSSQPGYDHQHGYNSAPGYGNPTQDGAAASYVQQGGPAHVPSSQQVPPPVQSAATPQQGYSGQQLGTTPPSYPSQVSAQPGYGMPPTSQPGYGSQPPAQSGFGQSAPLTQPGYGPPQAQKPPVQPLYGQSQLPPSTQGAYIQPVPAQPGYSHSQPSPTRSGYAQPDSTHHRPPSASFGTAGQPGYGQQPYGGPPAAQTGYGGQQQQQPYGDSYGGSYTQPPVYSSTDSNVAGNAHGTYEAPPSSQAVQQSGVAKTSPQS